MPVLILGVPIFDTTLVSISRARRGLLPFTSPAKTTPRTASRISASATEGRTDHVRRWPISSAALRYLDTTHLATATYAIVGGIVLLAFIAILYLENLPYERQVKIAKPAV